MTKEEVDDLSDQLKAFDKKVEQAGKDAAAAPPASPETAPQQVSVDQLQSQLGIISNSANPCDTCPDKACTVRNSGMASVNCREHTIVGPGGIIKNVQK